MDDASPEPLLSYLHERLGELEPIARGKEFGHIKGRRCLSRPVEIP